MLTYPGYKEENVFLLLKKKKRIKYAFLKKDLFIYLFIYLREREKERENMHAGRRARGRGRENPQGASPLSVAPDTGLNRRILTSRPEPKPRVNHLTNWVIQAPLKHAFDQPRKRKDRIISPLSLEKFTFKIHGQFYFFTFLLFLKISVLKLLSRAEQEGSMWLRVREPQWPRPKVRAPPGWGGRPHGMGSSKVKKVSLSGRGHPDRRYQSPSGVRRAFHRGWGGGKDGRLVRNRGLIQ